MKPVLILKFAYASQYGGGERHTELLAETIRERRGAVYFVGSCSVLLRDFRKRHIPARRWWAGKEPVSWWSVLLFPFTAIFAFAGLVGVLVWYRAVHRVKSLWCLSLTEKMLVTPVARCLGMKVFWAEHVAAGRWLVANPFRPLYTLSSRFATAVVISQNIAESLRGVGVPAEQIRVVYTGVDLGPYAELHRRTAHWTKQFLVGTVARLEEEKGISVLLGAFQKLLVVVPQARLIVVGEGTQRRKLEWLAKQLTIDRSVQWVGFAKNIPAWMKSFDLFVLPSVGREAFGIVLLEAMAAACPVVASNLGGIPEIIQNNRNGILVEPGDSELLMQAMLYLYRHPDVAMHLGATGRRWVEDRFSLPATLDQLLGLFP